MIQIPSLATASLFIKQIGKSLIILTPLQRKVLAIFACAVACVTISYAIGRRFKVNSRIESMIPAFKDLIKRREPSSSSIVHDTHLAPIPQLINEATVPEENLEQQQPIQPDGKEQRQGEKALESPLSEPLLPSEDIARPFAIKPQDERKESQSIATTQIKDESAEALSDESSSQDPLINDQSADLGLSSNTASHEEIVNDDVANEHSLPSSMQETGPQPKEAFLIDLGFPTLFEGSEAHLKELSDLESILEEKPHSIEIPTVDQETSSFFEGTNEVDSIEDLSHIVPSPDIIEEPLLFLKDKSDLEAVASQFINAKLYKLKCDVVSKFLDEIYQVKEVKCEEERTNCILYIADHLIKSHRVNETPISSFISSLKAYAKTASEGIQKTFVDLIDQLNKRQQALEILSSYKMLLFKKGDPWQELSNQEAFNLLKNSDNAPLDFDRLIKCMLICTFNEDKLDRSAVTPLLSKGLQLIRKEISTIDYGSAGNGAFILEKLYQKYLNVYSDGLKIKYANENGSLASHELFKKDTNQFIISMPLAHGHYTNTIVDVKGGDFKICDNCAAHLRYDELNTIAQPSLSQYTLYMPQTLYQSVKDRVQLKQLCIPRWEANNCYLSASWLTFAFLFYFYKQAHDVEQEALQKELIA
ncbi:Conserved hypothetical membrane protein [Candidatus Protochlamydia naegleriophila]|uniref:Conserved hypothetical membrane protein n=2 Tax=Candidatus Protochlamydia naegleriophila TaxID=389348 RepID=A0A0U5ESM6_9BACT|nr:Conserved hypothetical membrane protein [Candidatus Protochlamydia naegleriophila]